MSFSIPIYHWFHNGNPYSGAEGGMRFIITPGKRPDPADETGKKKWNTSPPLSGPGRGAWSTQRTKKSSRPILTAVRPGWDAAVAWLKERYAAEPERWEISLRSWTVSRINNACRRNNHCFCAERGRALCRRIPTRRR